MDIRHLLGTAPRAPRGEPGPAPDAPSGETFVGHYAELARQNLRLIGGATAAGALIAGTLAFAELRSDPVFEASARITIQPSEAELNYSQSYVRSSSLDTANVVTLSHMEYLKSRETAGRILEMLSEGGAAPAPEEPTGLAAVKRSIKRGLKFVATGRLADPDPEAAAIEAIREAISVGMIESSFIMEITVAWDDPEQAARIANALAEVYQERRRSEAQAATQDLTRYLTTRRDTAQAEVDRLLTERAALREQYGVLDLGAERNDLLSRISSAQSQRDATRAELRALDSKLAEFPVAAQSNARRGGMNDAAEEQLALDRIRRVELAELLNAREENLSDLRDRLRGLAGAEVPFSRIDEDIASARTQLDNVEERLLDAGLTDAAGLDGLRIVDRARPPLYPAEPNTLKSAAMGGAGGLILALMFLFGRDLRDPRLRTRADLSELGGARVLTDLRVVKGADGTPRLKGAGLERWSGFAQTGEAVILDAVSGARSRALAQAVVAEAPVDATLRPLALRHLMRPGVIAPAAGAALVTLPRGTMERDDLAERLRDVRYRLPDVRLAVAFLDVDPEALNAYPPRPSHTPAPKREEIARAEMPPALAAPMEKPAKPAPKRYKVRSGQGKT